MPVMLRACSKIQFVPVAGDHDTVAKSGEAGVMISVGTPGVCTACGKAQKPPVTENWPLVIGPPASGWLLVPVTRNAPTVLAP
jgi:hypothetical protein